MPAFYRMPVAYLTALVAVGLVVAIRRPDRVVEATPNPPAEPIAGEETPGDEPIRPVRPSAPDPILRNSQGLRRKVLVRELGLLAGQSADSPAGSGDPLDYLSIQFVFEETPPGRPSKLRVGPAAGPPVGWVPAESVVEWDTRLMARPTPRAGRPPW